LHKLFRVMKRSIDPSDNLTMGRALLFIQTLLTKPWVKRDAALFQEFMTHLDVSKVCPDKQEHLRIVDLLFQLITDNHGTLRYATSHMNDRDLFDKSTPFPTMTALKHVEEALEKHQLKIPEASINTLVIEEMARLDRKAKLAFIEKNAHKIAERRLHHNVPVVEWFIEDFFTGRYYLIPAPMILDQTKEEIATMERKDANTLKMFPVHVHEAAADPRSKLTHSHVTGVQNSEED